MPAEGELETNYGRVYQYIKPTGSDPGTWRLAVPESGADGGAGGGGGTGVTYDFDGEAPIYVSVLPGVSPNPTRVVTSLDINSLDRNT